MREEKFKVINLIRELIKYLDEFLDNFPKKELEIKNRIRKNSYDMLELAYEANMTKDNLDKQKLIYKTAAKVKIIDFLINLCYEKQIINSKKYIKFGNKIDDINKYLVGWLKSTLD